MADAAVGNEPAAPAATKPRSSDATGGVVAFVNSLPALPPPTPLGYGSAVVFGIVAVVGVALYPVGQVWLGLLLLLYAAALWRFPWLWLVVIPVVLPALDLSAVTGRVLLNELDLVVLVSLAVLAARLSGIRPARWPNSTLPAALLLLWLTWLVATARGLAPALDGPLPLSASHTPLEAWYVGKGLLWALLSVPLLRRFRRAFGSAASSWLFLHGAVIGAVLTLIIILWERAVFTGLWNLTSDFRVTGPFSSMSTGGAYIDAYLAFAFPILLVWTLKQATTALRLGGGLLVLVCGYGMLITYSRAGLLALAVGSGVAAIGLVLRKGSKSRTAWLALGAPVLLVIGLALAVLGGGFGQTRMALAAKDLDSRIDHWTSSLSLLEGRAGAVLFGAGFGQYPTLYIAGVEGGRSPGSYRVIDAEGKRFLRLGSGEPSFLDQRVRARAETGYRLTATLRFVGGADRLSVALCRKALLYSFGCVWKQLDADADQDGWQQFDTAIDSGKMGWSWLGAPIKLSLYVPGARGAVDVARIGLIGPIGEDLVANGDFRRGAARWLFTTDQRLGWHIDQQLIETTVAQGLLGLLALAVLLTAVIRVLWPAIRAGRLEGVAFAAALSGFLTVGLLGSTVDAPRTAMLFYFGALAAATLVRGNDKRSRRASATVAELRALDASPRRREA